MAIWQEYVFVCGDGKRFDNYADAERWEARIALVDKFSTYKTASPKLSMIDTILDVIEANKQIVADFIGATLED